MRKYSGKQNDDNYNRTIDGFDDNTEDDFDQDDLSRDIYSTDWGEEFTDQDSVSARRRIERHLDEAQLRSELRDWEEFGLNDDDY